MEDRIRRFTRRGRRSQPYRRSTEVALGEIPRRIRDDHHGKSTHEDVTTPETNRPTNHPTPNARPNETVTTFHPTPNVRPNGPTTEHDSFRPRAVHGTVEWVDATPRDLMTSPLEVQGRPGAGRTVELAVEGSGLLLLKLHECTGEQRDLRDFYSSSPVASRRWCRIFALPSWGVCPLACGRSRTCGPRCHSRGAVFSTRRPLVPNEWELLA